MPRMVGLCSKEAVTDTLKEESAVRALLVGDMSPAS